MSSPVAARLRAGFRLIGTVVTIADPLLAELACAAWDFVWIDLEHSPLDVADVGRLAVAARSAGCGTLVRVPGVAADRAAAVLDLGVDGLVVPRVGGVDDAGAIARALRYPPDGTRGFAHRRATGYGRHQPSDLAPICAVQIESGAAVADAARIGRVPGVDVLVVGLADLACDLGVAPALDAPTIREAIGEVRRGAAEAGVAWGLAAGGEPRHVTAAAAGAGMVVYSADARLYAGAIDRAAAALRAAAY